MEFTYDDLLKLAEAIDHDAILESLSKEALIIKVKALGCVIGQLGQEHKINPVKIMEMLMTIELSLIEENLSVKH